MYSRLLAILLLASGCNYLPYDGGVVCVQPGSPDWLAEETAESAEVWREVSQGIIDLQVIVSDEGCDITVYAGNISERHLAICYVGGVDHARIAFDPFKHHNAPAHITLAHELGHAMGAEHSDSKNDLMYENVYANSYPTSADVRQILE